MKLQLTFTHVVLGREWLFTKKREMINYKKKQG